MEARLEDPAVVTERNKTEKLLGEVKAMIQRAEEKAAERARAADKVIREHPYQSIGVTFGVAFGLGLLIGLLARKK